MQSSPKEYKPSASFTPEKQQWLFDEILRIYDLADNLMAVVADKDNRHSAVQLELAKPFLTQTINSTNILSAFYTEVVRTGRPVTPDLQDTIEGAFRIFFEAFDDLILGMEEKFLPKEEFT